MARFVTTARFVTKVTKRAAIHARFVTNEVVTNRAGIVPFLSLGYQCIVRACMRACVCVCVCAVSYTHLTLPTMAVV